jgi:hypothetical protein
MRGIKIQPDLRCIKSIEFSEECAEYISQQPQQTVDRLLFILANFLTEFANSRSVKKVNVSGYKKFLRTEIMIEALPRSRVKVHLDSTEWTISHEGDVLKILTVQLVSNTPQMTQNRLEPNCAAMACCRFG